MTAALAFRYGGCHFLAWRQQQLVIGDVSDFNAHVIYELGYTDANRTSLILLGAPQRAHGRPTHRRSTSN